MQKDAASKYKEFLGENKEGDERYEITGDLMKADIVENGVEKEIDLEENHHDGGFPNSPTRCGSCSSAMAPSSTASLTA